MFIVFEGTDGSGKTTQSEIFRQALADEGVSVIKTREPGGSEGAEEIRNLILSGETDKWSPETELLLFNAARRDHVEKTIRPALAEGKTVICDRFVGSTIAYQGARSPELGKKARVVHDAMIGINPDITFFLHRQEADAHVDGREMDRMERAQYAFRDKTRKMFTQQMREDKGWIGIFAQDKNLVSQTIMSAYQEAKQKLKRGAWINKIYADETFIRSFGGWTLAMEKEYPKHKMLEHVYVSDDEPDMRINILMDTTDDVVMVRSGFISYCGDLVQIIGVSPEYAAALPYELVDGADEKATLLYAYGRDVSEEFGL